MEIPLLIIYEAKLVGRMRLGFIKNHDFTSLVLRMLSMNPVCFDIGLPLPAGVRKGSSGNENRDYYVSFNKMIYQWHDHTEKQVKLRTEFK
jgi:hypothetical protein